MKIFDVHSDMPSRLMQIYGTNRTDSKVLESEFLPQMRQNNINTRVASAFIHDDYTDESLERAITMLQHLKSESDKIDDVQVVNSADDIKNEGISFILGLEGLEPINKNIKLVDAFYDLGVRVVGLTHARQNTVATGSLIDGYDKEVEKQGVSEFGYSVLNRLDELGIVIDTAHINTQGFWDVVEWSDKPIINSHSNSASLYDHPRNLTDEQLKAIAETGGVVSLNCASIFYGRGDYTDGSIDDFINHLNHVVDVIGVENTGVGFDFFSYLLDSKPSNSASGIEKLENDEMVSNLPHRLEKEGFSEKDVEKILWRNNIRVFEQILD